MTLGLLVLRKMMARSRSNLEKSVAVSMETAGNAL
jgi:hypothetical protein